MVSLYLLGPIWSFPMGPFPKFSTVSYLLPQCLLKIPTEAGKLTQWLRNLLLLQRPGLSFSAPRWDGSQTPITPISGCQHPLLALCGTCFHMYIRTQECTELGRKGIFFFFFLFIYFWDSISLQSPGCPRHQYMEQAELTETCLIRPYAGMKGVHH